MVIVRPAGHWYRLALSLPPLISLTGLWCVQFLQARRVEPSSLVVGCMSQVSRQQLTASLSDSVVLFGSDSRPPTDKGKASAGQVSDAATEGGR